MSSILPALTVVVPAAAVPAIYVLRDRPNAREAVTLLAALGTIASAASLVPAALAGDGLVTPLGRFLGLAVAFRADAFGTLFALLASSLWLVTSVYSVGYVRTLGERNQSRYFAAFAASTAATMGVALGATLLTLFVCYELLTLATYPLVAHAETDEARRSGRKYVRYGLSGGAALFAGLLLLTATAGPTAFTPGGIPAVAGLPTGSGRAAFALLVAGFGVKAAIVPLHAWLPEAMVAPTPVSGLLHAVAVVKSGVFGVGRVVLFVFGPEFTHELGVALPLAAVATLTIVYTSVVALRQDKLKRGIAYSTVSHLGYVVLGLALATPAAAFGALLHIVAHAFMKLTVFLSVGAVYVETGREYVSGIDGIGRRLPLTMTAFGVAAAGLVGFPAVAGFVSKWYLMLGAARSDYPVLVAAFLAGGVLKLLYFWPIVLRAFYSEGDLSDLGFAAETHSDGGAGHGSADHGAGEGGWQRRSFRDETTWLLLGPIVAAAVGAVVLGVRPGALPFFALAEQVVEEVFRP